MTYLEAARPSRPAQQQRTSDARDADADGSRRLQQLRGTVRQAERFHAEQVLDHLNPRMREFVGRQEMMFIATADPVGMCDSSFRAGPPGFVHVLNDRRLLWPEYRGNGVMASVGNIVDNPYVGLLFVDFFRDTVGLHVNGRAELVPDNDIQDAYPDLPVDPAPGRRPVHWLTVHVDEAFIHCSKRIPQLSRAPSDGEGRNAANRADFFGVRVDRSALVLGPGASGGAGGPVESSRWSFKRLLALRSAIGRGRADPR